MLLAGRCPPDDFTGPPGCAFVHLFARPLVSPRESVRFFLHPSLSFDLRQRIEPLLPKVRRGKKGDRPPVPLRGVMGGVFYVLWTARGWKAAPPQFWIRPESLIDRHLAYQKRQHDCTWTEDTTSGR